MGKALGTLGTVDTITVGGRTFTDVSSLIILFAEWDSSAQFATFRKSDGTPYQVPGGKTFTVRAAKFGTNGSSIVDGILLYGDTNIGFASGSAPTNPVYFAGNSTLVQMIVPDTLKGAELAPLDFAVPTGKYPGIKGQNARGLAYVYGYEV